MNPVIYLSDSEAQAGATKWLSILRLRDWDVVVKIMPKHVMGDRFGFVNVLAEKRQASISLLDHKEYPPSEDWFRYDMEQTLVHEILHIYTDLMVCQVEQPFYDAHISVPCEQMVDALATILVNQQRERSHE